MIIGGWRSESLWQIAISLDWNTYMASGVHGSIRVEVEETGSHIGVVHADGIVFRNREDAILLLIIHFIPCFSTISIKLLTPKLSTAVTVLLWEMNSWTSVGCTRFLLMSNRRMLQRSLLMASRGNLGLKVVQEIPSVYRWERRRRRKKGKMYRECSEGSKEVVIGDHLLSFGFSETAK